MQSVRESIIVIELWPFFGKLLAFLRTTTKFCEDRKSATGLEVVCGEMTRLTE